LGFAVVYYFLFRFVIRRWNLKTPGREEEGEESSLSLDPTAA
jgi:PTS system N-acetylglucosamine-specific IIC component